MIYLLIKFLILLLIASIIGFLLGRWSIKRKFEEVTEFSETLVKPLPTETLQPPSISKSDEITKEDIQSNHNEEGPQLLSSASHGEKDDLKRISGVGPKLEGLCNDLGIYYFWQVADWTESDIQIVDDRLKIFKGRIKRDDWVSQAKRLASETASANRP